MPLHSFKPHFVGEGLFAGQNHRALEIGLHHENDGFIPCQVSDLCPDGVKARKLTGLFSSVTGNKLVATVRLLPKSDWDYDAPFLDALHQQIHVLVHSHLKGMVREVVNLVDGNVVDAGKLVFSPFPVGHEKLIEPIQAEALLFGVLQAPAPPSSARRRPGRPCRLGRRRKCSRRCG